MFNVNSFRFRIYKDESLLNLRAPFTLLRPLKFHETDSTKDPPLLRLHPDRGDDCSRHLCYSYDGAFGIAADEPRPDARRPEHDGGG